MNTPKGNRPHIGIFGQTNAGKSTLFNLLLNSDIATVSNVKGTTTDPVYKATELLGFGAVVFVDTAGLDDFSEIGKKRIEKTNQVIDKIDLGLYLIDCNDYDKEEFFKIKNQFNEKKIKLIKVISKSDKLINDKSLLHVKQPINTEINDKSEKIYVSNKSLVSIEKLKKRIIKELKKDVDDEKALLEGISSNIKQILLVVPIDSQAPKGRLILPQAQVIRECLDKDIISTIINDKMLANMKNDLSTYDLVITDSRIFQNVSQLVDKKIHLTTFSILFARQKGDLKAFIKGIDKIKDLKNNNKILIVENCHHTKNHEDIGKVVIPQKLNMVTGKKLKYEFLTGHDYTSDITNYALVINCGGCMITRKNMTNRIDKNEKLNIPITNYGLFLSYVAGQLERSIKIFKKELI